MKKEFIKKGQEAEAVSFLSNRTDDDFDAIDASVKEIISKVRERRQRVIRADRKVRRRVKRRYRRPASFRCRDR